MKYLVVFLRGEQIFAFYSPGYLCRFLSSTGFLSPSAPPPRPPPQKNSSSKTDAPERILHHFCAGLQQLPRERHHLPPPIPCTQWGATDRRTKQRTPYPFLAESTRKRGGFSSHRNRGLGKSINNPKVQTVGGSGPCYGHRKRITSPRYICGWFLGNVSLCGHTWCQQSHGGFLWLPEPRPQPWPLPQTPRPPRGQLSHTQLSPGRMAPR